SAFLVFHFHGASSSRMRMKKKLQGGKLKKAHAYRLSPASVSPLHQSPPTPPLLPPLTKALKLSALRPKGTPVIPLTSHLSTAAAAAAAAVRRRSRVMESTALLFIVSIPLLHLLLLSSAASCPPRSCQVSLLDSCSTADDCAPGLYCGSCPASGNVQPACVRALAYQPTAFVLIPSLFSLLPLLLAS
ncbi:hypothetical protein BHM03_00021327, partial [Ensete ventricosum]